MSKDTTQPAASNPFGEGFSKAEPAPFVKWEMIGQIIKGTFIESYTSKSALNNKDMVIYILQGEDGNEFRISKDDKFFNMAMNKVLRGQQVGFCYKEEIPATKKGYKPFKKIDVYPGQMDQAWLDKNRTSSETADGIAF